MGKKQPRQGTKISSLMLVFVCTILTSFGQFFLKKGMDNFSFSVMAVLTNMPLLLGVFFYVSTAILMVIALRGGELSVLYPIIATGYVWVSLISFFVLKEEMNLLKISGVALILLGVSFIGYGSQKKTALAVTHTVSGGKRA